MFWIVNSNFPTKLCIVCPTDLGHNFWLGSQLEKIAPIRKRQWKVHLKLKTFFFWNCIFFLWPRKKSNLNLSKTASSITDLKKGANSVNFIFRFHCCCSHKQKEFLVNWISCAEIWICCDTGFYNLLWFTHYFVFTQQSRDILPSRSIAHTIVILGNFSKKVKHLSVVIWYILLFSILFCAEMDEEGLNFKKLLKNCNLHIYTINF